MAAGVIAQAAGDREMPAMLVAANAGTVDTHIEIQMQPGTAWRDGDLWLAHAKISQPTDRVVSAWVMYVEAAL